MCGVIALWHPGTPVAEHMLEPALQALHHRGPDGRGTFLDPAAGVALGHTRLAIIDPEDGAQPIASEDGSIVASVNGELYEFEHQRAQLRARGHRFRTGSDSEIAVHLYEEHGVDFVHHLRGEFALVLWDRRRRRLIAARDRFGVKPLVWSGSSEGVVIASEAKALFALGVPARWDHRSMVHAATHQYLPPSRTCFRGVHAVPPGHLLIAEGRGEPTVRRYWDLDPPLADDRTARSPSPAEREAMAEELGVALDEAVRLRLRADVPLGFYLSGGLDSAAIAALAARAGARPLRCFSMRFTGERMPGAAVYDESHHARTVAAHLGAELISVDADQDALLGALSDAVFYAEGPGINGQLPAKLLLARAARSAGVPVVLTGEGSDEALFGYPHLVADALAHSRDPRAGAWRRALDDDSAASRGVMMPDGEAPELEAVRAALGTVPTWMRAKALLGRRLAELMTADIRAAAGRDRVWTELLEELDVRGQLAGRSPVVVAAYLWSRLAMTGYILRTLGDGTEMAASVEGRPPFLDHRLFESLRRVPVEAQMHGGIEKQLLRRALRGLLPDVTLRRRKHPLLAPPVTVYGGQRCWALIEDTLRSQAVDAVPFLDRRRIAAVLDRLPALDRQQRASAEPAIMMALCAVLMHRRFDMETT